MAGGGLTMIDTLSEVTLVAEAVTVLVHGSEAVPP
jgi:hypothetical protein